MKVAGFLLLPSGWIIVLAAVVLLPVGPPQQGAFLLAGVLVELLGLALVVRSHIIARGDHG